MKKTKLIKCIVVFAIAILVALFIWKKIDNNKCVTFKDPAMQANIYEALKDSSSLSKGFSKNHMTKGDLKKLKELTIIMWQDYTTLEDLKYCVNLKTLTLNSYIKARDFSYYQYQHDIDPELDFDDYVKENKLSSKKCEQFQNEICAIAPDLKKLTELCIQGDALCQLTSLQFVAALPHLEILQLINLTEIENFAPLRECSNIKKLDITHCKIYDAKDLLNFDYLEEMYLWYTFICGNEKETRLLEKAYPDADIKIYSNWADVQEGA